MTPLMGHLKYFSLAFVFVASASALAQQPSPSGSDDEIETLYDRLDSEGEKKAPPPPTKTAEPIHQEKKDVSSLSELSGLAPFSDIAVISRKFLPKTNRFSFSAMPMLSMNNAFFSNYGFDFRGAYYFKEKYGVEGMYYLLSSSQRDITQNLRDKRNIETRSLVVPKGYLGGAFKWVPVYGKMAWLNRTIVPFDLYFTGGLGLTRTAEKSGEPTFHVGTGQIFALSKSLAIRWDLAWNIYQATAVEKQGDGSLKTAKKAQNDLFLSIGVSFFYPEATYR